MKQSEIMVCGVYLRPCGQFLKVEGLGNGRVCYSVVCIGMMRTDYPRFCSLKTFAAKVRWDFSRTRREIRAVLEAAAALVKASDRQEHGAPDAFEALRAAIRRLPFAAGKAIFP